MTSKDANLRFLDELHNLGALNVDQVQRQREQYNRTDKFETILAYGQVNQGILCRVANNYGTSLFPFSRTISSPYFSHFQAPQYPLALYPFMYNPYVPMLPYPVIPLIQTVVVPVPVFVPTPAQTVNNPSPNHHPDMLSSGSFQPHDTCQQLEQDIHNTYHPQSQLQPIHYPARQQTQTVYNPPTQRYLNPGQEPYTIWGRDR